MSEIDKKNVKFRIWWVIFMNGFVDGSLVRTEHRIFYAETLKEVLNDLRNFRIYAFLATELGVSPFLFGALGFSVKEAKILTISVCPLCAAQ